jgi:hypothetical protein
MPRVWVVRTDVNHVDDVILPSLEAGELRQGRSGRPDEDLNIIGPIVDQRGRGALNAAQKATWRRVQRFWSGHWDPVQPGDLVLLPKVPGVGAVGAGRGHRDLPVRPASQDARSRPHPAGQVAVVGHLADQCRGQRTTPADDAQSGPDVEHHALADDVTRLLEAGTEVAAPDGASVRLQAVLNDTLTRLLDRVRDDFQANQLEEPVHRLLDRVFDDASVERKTGPGEHGADFVIREADRFGHEHTTVVQLKDYATLSGDRPLDQVREAVAWYAPVSAAVILSTASEETNDFSRARDELSEELGIPVKAVLGRQLAQWFLVHLEAVAAD